MNFDYSSMYRLILNLAEYLFFKILGLSPWKDLQIFPKAYKRNYSISYVGSSYNIVLFFSITLFAFYNLFDKSLNQTYLGSTLALVIIQFLFIKLVFASSISLVYIIRQKLLISINNRIKDVDVVLKKIENCETNHNFTNDFIFITNSATTVFLIIILDTVYYPLTRVLFENLPTVISGAVIVQFAMLLNRVNRRFESIHSSFSKFSHPKVAAQKRIVFVSEKLQSPKLILDNIDDLKSAFVELSEICQEVANFFGIPLLISIFCFAIRIIFSVYFIILSLFKIPTLPLVWSVNIPRLSWICFVFLVLTSSVTAVMKQNQKLGKTLNLLTDKQSIEVEVKNRLAKFSSDLVNLRIELTACDIIPLDRTLLAIVTGTIASYLIIGVQFAFNSS